MDPPNANYEQQQHQSSFSDSSEQCPDSGDDTHSDGVDGSEQCLDSSDDAHSEQVYLSDHTLGYSPIVVSRVSNTVESCPVPPSPNAFDLEVENETLLAVMKTKVTGRTSEQRNKSMKTHVKHFEARSKPLRRRPTRRKGTRILSPDSSILSMESLPEHSIVFQKLHGRVVHHRDTVKQLSALLNIMKESRDLFDDADFSLVVQHLQKHGQAYSNLSRELEQKQEVHQRVVQQLQGTIQARASVLDGNETLWGNSPELLHAFVQKQLHLQNLVSEMEEKLSDK
jgi:hypothetical protein